MFGWLTGLAATAAAAIHSLTFYFLITFFLLLLLLLRKWVFASFSFYVQRINVNVCERAYANLSSLISLSVSRWMRMRSGGSLCACVCIRWRRLPIRVSTLAMMLTTTTQCHKLEQVIVHTSTNVRFSFAKKEMYVSDGGDGDDGDGTKLYMK